MQSDGRGYSTIHTIRDVVIWQGVPIVWATQFYRREAAFLLRELCITDLTEKLPFGTVILVEERLGGATAGADVADRDVTFRAAADGAYFLSVTFFKVRDEFLVSPVLPEVSDTWEFINFEFLIFGRMGIIKSHCLSGIYLQIKFNNQQFI